MKNSRWIAWVAIGGLVLASCAVPGSGRDSSLRTRAWLLFRTPPSQEAAAAIDGLLNNTKDEYVVVRADAVKGEFSLVVPVDVSSEADLAELIRRLSELVGSEPTVLIVTQHNPAKTTTSHSWVTPQEWEGFEKDFREPGEQVPNSPGANPWG